MNRRSYITAIAAIMGASGCLESTSSSEQPTITKEEAMKQFTDIQEFEPPTDELEKVSRFVDEDAGVVFWGFYHQVSGHGSGSQFEVVSKHLDDTDLTPTDKY